MLNPREKFKVIFIVLLFNSGSGPLEIKLRSLWPLNWVWRPCFKMCSSGRSVVVSCSDGANAENSSMSDASAGTQTPLLAKQRAVVWFLSPDCRHQWAQTCADQLWRPNESLNLIYSHRLTHNTYRCTHTHALLLVSGSNILSFSRGSGTDSHEGPRSFFYSSLLLLSYRVCPPPSRHPDLYLLTPPPWRPLHHPTPSVPSLPLRPERNLRTPHHLVLLAHPAPGPPQGHRK